MQRKKLIFMIFSVLLVISLIGIAVKNERSKEAALNLLIDKEDGTKQIAFETKLTQLDETTTTLAAYKGKVLIINVWASWCGPCQEEAPDLKDFYDKKPDNVELLAINATSSDSRENAIKFQQLYNLNFPIFLDLDGSLGKSLEIMAYPTTFIIDAEGNLKHTIKGQINQQQLTKLLTNL
ncbi:TlpA disulfide reductase family protein [Lysinibacillus sphaericus]|uniref:TlpA disulfide reductase family protein n=1 Tax=Lysinibacillus sphaericus TaxID=1421 RepID=UPI001C5F6F20